MVSELADVWAGIIVLFVGAIALLLCEVEKKRK